jgi:hypothetical protein
MKCNGVMGVEGREGGVGGGLPAPELILTLLS